MGSNNRYLGNITKEKVGEAIRVYSELPQEERVKSPFDEDSEYDECQILTHQWTLWWKCCADDYNTDLVEEDYYEVNEDKSR